MCVCVPGEHAGCLMALITDPCPLAVGSVFGVRG